MERWAEHYSDLYSRENTVSPAALDAIECLPSAHRVIFFPTLVPGSGRFQLTNLLGYS